MCKQNKEVTAMKKGTCITRKDGKAYTVAGRWDRDVVLAPVDGNDDQVLIYGKSELDDLIKTCHFSLSGQEASIMTRRFSRKAANLEELKSVDHREATRGVVIEKIITLTAEEFNAFASDLLADQDFIRDNKDLMHMDDDFTCHCILVKTQGGNDGVLVESELYDYPRYSAYWQEESKCCLL